MTRSDPLWLHEEILLLALRDKEGTFASGSHHRHALGGAILAELLLAQRIRQNPEAVSPGYWRIHLPLQATDHRRSSSLAKASLTSRRQTGLRLTPRHEITVQLDQGREQSCRHFADRLVRNRRVAGVRHQVPAPEHVGPELPVADDLGRESLLENVRLTKVSMPQTAGRYSPEDRLGFSGCS
jgi:hypothetical protein